MVSHHITTILPPYPLAVLPRKWVMQHGRQLSFLACRCVLCRQVMIRQSLLSQLYDPCCAFLCETCHNLTTWQVPMAKIPTSNRKLPLFAASFYQYPINHALNAFKDKEHLPSFLMLIHALNLLPKPEGASRHNTVIIPVPTTNQRLKHRGFNPTLALARYLSYHWKIPVWQGVVRIDDASHQRGLDRDKRLKNIKNAFYVSKVLSVKQAVLFDDVVTTGATLSAMASALWQTDPDLKMLAVCVAHGRDGFSKLGG
ncbi:ComF family protein [Moraxella nasovis]|uniref:ComF family protein n=1 Tax=Moraxella nasovis TaxID=2904121 RepID=UPI001F6158BC|nr:ComF family protein [Moraxella nasovis]UNU73744.1 ComF family protein [Moraxella nasovis]